jgi:hypothetical protein
VNGPSTIIDPSALSFASISEHDQIPSTWKVKRIPGPEEPERQSSSVNVARPIAPDGCALSCEATAIKPTATVVREFTVILPA